MPVTATSRSETLKTGSLGTSEAVCPSGPSPKCARSSHRRRPGNLFERACIPAGGGFDIRFLDLPEDLIFNVNYLGGNMPTLSLLATCLTLGSGASGGVFSPCMWFEDLFDRMPGNYYTRHTSGMLLQRPGYCARRRAGRSGNRASLVPRFRRAHGMCRLADDGFGQPNDAAARPGSDQNGALPDGNRDQLAERRTETGADLDDRTLTADRTAAADRFLLSLSEKSRKSVTRWQSPILTLLLRTSFSKEREIHSSGGFGSVRRLRSFRRTSCSSFVIRSRWSKCCFQEVTTTSIRILFGWFKCHLYAPFRKKISRASRINSMHSFRRVGST